ncbi:Uncharacterised protein [Cardiobacterium valvarum]|uniref:Uncharacterized protein n=1 Tax=Cardiobacterium valvarum TaxID=194702 RepID=A0A381ECK8_9GAMM|nr:Uncharacterised protein [Cardiobacterium valvarum]
MKLKNFKPRPMREEADALQQFMEERRRINHSRTIPTEGA